MSLLTIPNTLVNGTGPANIIDAVALNANFTAIATAVNNIYPSQILPITTGQATFGATATGVGYKFLANDATATPLVISGVTSQTANIQNWTLTSGGTPVMSLDNLGELGIVTTNTAAIPLYLVVPTSGASAFKVFNTSLAGTLLASITNTGQIQGTVSGGVAEGMMLPAYGTAGAALAATGHLVIVQFAGTGGTVTLTLTNSAATFTNGATYGGIAMDVTAAGSIAATNASGTSVQFAGTTNGHTYMAFIFGY